MNENKNFDKLIDQLIHDASNIAAENLGKDMPEPEKAEFSKEHEEEMKKMFKRERNNLLRKKLSRHSRCAAIFLLILIAASSIMIFSVEAWRIKVMNFIIEIKQTHSEISFSDDNTGGGAYKSDEITLDYIPYGFELEKSDMTDNSVNLIFKGEDNYFIFSMDPIDIQMGIDTENASVKKIVINGDEALYSSNNNINILVWHDEELSYKLSGTIKEDEMIKIAEKTKN